MAVGCGVDRGDWLGDGRVKRDVPEFIPTPDQIRTACDEIRESWTPQQEKQRATRDRKRNDAADRLKEYRDLMESEFFW